MTKTPMNIVELIYKEAGPDRWRLLLASTAAGVGNTLVLVFINAAAQAPDAVDGRTFFLFAVLMLAYILGARYLFHRTIDIVEEILHRIKGRIVEKILRADFAALERLGTSEIYDRITENATVISGAAGLVTNVLQQLLIFLFAIGYIAWMSLSAFVLLGILTAAGLALYWTRSEVMVGFLQHLAKTRVAFFDVLTDLLRGFKEVRFSRTRGQQIRDDVMRTSADLRDTTRKANHLFDDNFILASCNLFVLLGALVFVLPRHVHMEPATLTKLVSGVMFLWGPLQGAVSGYPAYVRSNQALREIETLERKLDAAAAAKASEGALSDPWKGKPGVIVAQGVEYEYARKNGDEAFRIGPANFTIDPGEIIFIVGGNGSGKSTLLKVLTGLYGATAGTLFSGGEAVRPQNAPAYREMISAIFSDFHLFSKAYGLLDVDGQAVSRLLAQMQLEGKTEFKVDRFTRRDLSTGQRKRLAMVVSLLEDRPIHVFDEWAADQDPEFRKYFYEELLPALKARGKTVIAVSHDDRYFHCADRVFTMEYGKLLSIEPGHRAAARPRTESTEQSLPS
ncbi:cyclic peptide export ABC transporter [Polyangium sp. 15x6]|uniref:cyclic peptide export ABC transporter n=1 Tax=Polyangium sp. 15x6 TaxID=3042687 RepID=UPI00249BBABC|nr:cyclic peptide export ABC transporter [Polyangium sp. 15x6]